MTGTLVHLDDAGRVVATVTLRRYGPGSVAVLVDDGCPFGPRLVQLCTSDTEAQIVAARHRCAAGNGGATSVREWGGRRERANAQTTGLDPDRGSEPT